MPCIRSILFFLLLLNIQTLLAQPDSKVTTGVIAYQQQDYEKAFEALNAALADPALLKEKNIAKAYYYRGKTRLFLMQQVFSSGDDAQAEKFQNAPLEAFYDLQKAKEHDDGQWEEKINEELNFLLSPLLQSGMMYLQKGSEKTLKKNAEQFLNEQVIAFMDAVIAINNRYYMPYDLRGQAYYNLKNDSTAYADFEKAITLFQAGLPEKPDLFFAYVFYRMALIDRYTNRDLNKALNNIKEGIKALETEWKRSQALKTSYSEEDWQTLKEQYERVANDLSGFKLDIYLNYPEKRQEALAEFEKAVEENPNDYVKHVAYANLLESTDPEKAASVYMKAIQIAPERKLAYYNLGALLNNAATDYFKVAEKEDDPEKAQQLQDHGNEILKIAMPHFEKYLEIDPGNPQVIKALKQIYLRLHLEDKYEEME